MVGRVQATVTGQRLKDLDGLGDPDGERRGRGRIDRLDAVVVDLGREGQVARLELDALAGARHGRLDRGGQAPPVGDLAGQVEDVGALERGPARRDQGPRDIRRRTGTSSGR